ncbi:Monoamine oxidase N [Metarhizium brunneum]|uniref:Amine oxidase n=1 Tax=Metarhizium brunneum TaxID=500148 RepID=A0A7D5UPL3_9HYPO|nr:Monoamine oxidase N [Metarhizium brunneum]
MAQTKDGFTWTPSAGRSTGLPSISVVSPPVHLAAPKLLVYDVIVIGSGYAGLTAARDLAVQGKQTLLVEARDRFGGRSWNASINGSNYEMGGTWIHWHMPHIYREVSLYGLHNDWVVTQNPGSKEDYCTLTSGDDVRNMSHDMEDEITGKAWELFCNIDGDHLRQTWKYPFATGQSPELMAKWDQISCLDRLNEIRHLLTKEETAVLECFLQQMGGNSLDRMGLLDALRWWTLGSHEPNGLNNIALHTRLGSGNSRLHRRMFEHTLSTGNLSYTFNTPVCSIEESTDGIVSVKARGGQTFRAKAVISTIPLNVLSSITFSPPLPAVKLNAALEGSVNKCNKVHVDLKGPDFLSWSGMCNAGKGLISLFGDGLTRANDSHLVGFGPDPERPNGIKLDNIDAIKEAALHLLPKEKRDSVDIERIVSHDWNNDEFSKGTWCYLPPKVTTKHLEALQQPHGRVFFASGDWSDGWRGWIDGAVQSGMQVAHQVIQLQRAS